MLNKLEDSEFAYHNDTLDMKQGFKFQMQTRKVTVLKQDDDSQGQKKIYQFNYRYIVKHVDMLYFIHK